MNWTIKETREGQVHILDARGRVIAECIDTEVAQLMVCAPELYMDLSNALRVLLTAEGVEQGWIDRIKAVLKRVRGEK